ncbi:L-threonylcarbamoyladenylate synthase [Flavobacterium sp. W22_SRS_FP1]|uniref:L-threonylcarbamoyladenylate synthase n=1 Tax=Flavobacterium sp. W22_SRS_FP1 TaxID=3240276 RepID=UPI003F8EE176
MIIVSEDILKAADILKEENLVAIPTETVYGLAGNIYSEKAIKAIFEMKQRPFFNPLIVHIKSIAQLDELAKEIPEKARLLADKFWPGSLTMVLKKQESVPDLVTAGKESVAIRIPNHAATLALLEALDFPLAAPSANPFGCISPTSASHVVNYFAEKLRMVLDGGNCQNGIESTIIGFEDEEAVLYRLGSISVEDIEGVIGKIQIKNKKESAPHAPGMLSKHYAPVTPTFLINDVAEFIKEFPERRIGLLLFKDKVESTSLIHQEVLSVKGDLKEAASNLYAAMHRLDMKKLDMIVAEQFPDFELGKSINDRLERATAK